MAYVPITTFLALREREQELLEAAKGTLPWIGYEYYPAHEEARDALYDVLDRHYNFGESDE